MCFERETPLDRLSSAAIVSERSFRAAEPLSCHRPIGGTHLRHGSMDELARG